VSRLFLLVFAAASPQSKNSMPLNNSLLPNNDLITFLLFSSLLSEAFLFDSLVWFWEGQWLNLSAPRTSFLFTPFCRLMTSLKLKQNSVNCLRQHNVCLSETNEVIIAENPRAEMPTVERWQVHNGQRVMSGKALSEGAFVLCWWGILSSPLDFLSSSQVL
jgi:hypothetical protein